MPGFLRQHISCTVVMGKWGTMGKEEAARWSSYLTSSVHLCGRMYTGDQFKASFLYIFLFILPSKGGNRFTFFITEYPIFLVFHDAQPCFCLLWLFQWQSGSYWIRHYWLATPLIKYFGVFNFLSTTILINDKLWKWHRHLVSKQICIIMNHIQYTINTVLYTTGVNIWSNIYLSAEICDTFTYPGQIHTAPHLQCF